MKFKEIISVPGMSGLFKIIANNKGGFIVESLNDAKRIMIPSTQRVLTLTDVALYIKDGEMPLRDVFKRISEGSGEKSAIDIKGDQQKMREAFKKLIPEFDEEKVYNSDIKKILSWFESLNGKVDFAQAEENDEDGKALPAAEKEKPAQKHHEAHGPKTENAKITATKTRKKV